jgi:hypothetical protein
VRLLVEPAHLANLLDKEFRFMVDQRQERGEHPLKRREKFALHGDKVIVRGLRLLKARLDHTGKAHFERPPLGPHLLAQADFVPASEKCDHLSSNELGSLARRMLLKRSNPATEVTKKLARRLALDYTSAHRLNHRSCLASRLVSTDPVRAVRRLPSSKYLLYGLVRTRIANDDKAISVYNLFQLGPDSWL